MQSRALVVLLLVIPSAVAQHEDVNVSTTSSANSEIRLKPTSTPPYGALPANAFVSASDLAVPDSSGTAFTRTKR